MRGQRRLRHRHRWRSHRRHLCPAQQRHRPGGAGNAKIIGTLSNERLPAFPDVPTFAEVFPDEIDYEMMGFCIISSPAGTWILLIQELSV